MGFLILIALLAVFIFVCAIIGKINDAKRARLMNRINKIKSAFPLAFEKYTSVNKININSANNDKLEYIIFRSEYEWAKEERQLRNEEQKRIAIDKSYQEIYVKYPDGLKKWLKLHNNSKKEEIVANKYKIQDYQKFYIEAQENNKWEKEQIEYRNQVLSLQKKIMPNEGRYYYKIPFQKINDDGVLVDGTFGVWQIFIRSYCRENNLDYSGFEYVQERTSRIEAFKQKNRFFIKQVYQRLNDFLIELSQKQPISVYLCANNKEWEKESLSYHYFDRSLFAVLPDNIEVIDPSTDSVLLDEELNYEDYPTLKNRHIVIIEMQTQNDHLREVCKKVIDENKKIHPLITYISFLKEYDRKEMIGLIEREKEKKEEEEARRLSELAKYKPDRNAIVKVLQDNGIRCFYHFTARENLSSIRQLGGLFSWYSMEQRGKVIPCPGGGGLSRQLDQSRGLEDYVRLSFTKNHPMMYVARNEGRIANPVVLKVNIDVAALKGTKYSNKNATIRREPVNIGDSISDLKQIHFQTVRQINHFNLEDDEKSFYQAEVLVRSFIPIDFIMNIDNPIIP